MQKPIPTSAVAWWPQGWTLEDDGKFEWQDDYLFVIKTNQCVSVLNLSFDYGFDQLNGAASSQGSDFVPTFPEL